MRKKLWMMALVCTMSAAVFTGCGGENEAQESSTATEEVQPAADSSAAQAEASADENAIYGVVSKVGADTITIKLGTRKQMEQPDGSAAPAESPAADDAEKDSDKQKEAPSMLDLTGEKQKITITDDTQLSRMTMGDMGQRGDGQQPQGTPPSGGDGQQPQGTPPSGGDGNQPQGTPPSGGDGQQPQGTPPSGGDGQQSQGTPPSGGGGTAPGETISLGDISVGDTVQVVLDDDGKATSIQVLSAERGQK